MFVFPQRVSSLGPAGVAAIGVGRVGRSQACLVGASCAFRQVMKLQ